MSQPRLRWIWMLSVFGLLALTFSSSAMASPIQDIPQALGDTLGIDPEAAGYILSAAILMSAGLALAIAGRRPNILATIIVLITIMIALVVIGWLDYWVAFLVAVLVAALFGTRMRDLFGGD